jgi:hypothetical protein
MQVRLRNITSFVIVIFKKVEKRSEMRQHQDSRQKGGQEYFF